MTSAIQRQSSGGGVASGRACSGSPRRPDAWALLRSAQAGDVQAFGLLWSRYSQDVYRFARSRVGERCAAEDTTSETFLRALRGIDSVQDQRGSVRGWLLTICRNLTLDHVRSGRFRHEVMVEEFAERMEPALPEFPVLAQVRNAELAEQLEELSEDQRTCLMLRFFEELSVGETARVMGRSTNAVRVLQHRAVRRLAGLVNPVAVR